MLSREEVLEIAELARLALSDDEIEALQSELADIVGLFEKLAAVDTAGVEPMTHAVPMDLPMREDETESSLPVDRALAAAPAARDDSFVVPNVLEGGS